MMTSNRLVGQNVAAMPTVTFASDYRQTGFVLPPQLAQFGPGVEEIFQDLFSGDQPVVPGHCQRAFMIAALDEIGRGTHPSKIKDRLLTDFEGDQDVPRAA